MLGPKKNDDFALYTMHGCCFGVRGASKMMVLLDVMGGVGAVGQDGRKE